jgi:TonB family protein
MVIAFAILALILQAGAAPTSAPALEYFVISPQNDIHTYNCETGEKVPGQTIIPGTVVLLVEETAPLLKAIKVETGQTLCLKVGKKDLIPIQPLRARDGTLASFPGKIFGIKIPLVFLSETLADPEVKIKGIPATPGIFTTAILLLQGHAQDVSDLLPTEQTLLVMVVNKDGHVSRCQILRPSGHSDGDRMAEQTVCSARYGAASQGGHPVAVTLVLQFVSTP